MNSYSSVKRRSGDVQIAVFQYAVSLVFLWLLSGFWQLQVQNPQIYAARADRNRIKSVPVLAPRGKILDRDGRIIVDNSPSHKVLLSRAAFRRDHLGVISEGLHLPQERLAAKLDPMETTRVPELGHVMLKEGLTMAEVAFIETHRSQLPELELMHSQRRLYPRDGLGAHVLGYVSEISDAELDQDEFMFYEPGAEIGKAGIERQYNDILTGTDGRRLVEVDSSGRERKLFGTVEAKPGRSIRLTLDLDLQVVAELAMNNRNGAVVALDPRSGEVLALVSRPTFDPNKFVGGISAEDWRRVKWDPDHPMMNRAIQAQLAPGSAFKPIVALAALEDNMLDDDFRVLCNGGASFYSRYFRCHLRGGHGVVNLNSALAQSCNVYFYTLGNRLGIDRIAKYAGLVGLGRPTGIDLPHEKGGLVPSSNWKLKFFREKWYAGETISVSIGQGALTVTPLQLAYAIGGLAMGGVWHRPRLVSNEVLNQLRPGEEPPEPVRVSLKREHVDRIVKGLWTVVNGGGTGVRARIPGYDICGKTGTAQLASSQYLASQSDPKLRDSAWFVGFAPCSAPEIVVAALFENGEHGPMAAPIVRDVIKCYADKQRRLEWARRARSPGASPEPASSPQPAALISEAIR